MSKTQQKRIDELLGALTSAYQENAITNILDDVKNYETAEAFADECCWEYRYILKSAGFGGSLIYKGFYKYGDECEVNDTALKVYEIAK